MRSTNADTVDLALCLRVDVYFGGTAAVPGGKEHTTAPTLVLNVLERIHDIRNASETEAAAEKASPCAMMLSAVVQPGAGLFARELTG